MQRFLEKLPFAPDDFQLDAMRGIEEGHSVVVCSPTGSGKTLVAEFAAFKAIHEGRKVFYTTPLKALSNQKFQDFKREYGEQAVGLLTGDTSINRDAQIVVMTTEVFRNMLYGIQEDSRLLRQVSCVVLDECHFMNDAERGTVWEESIIYCPDTIQIIALSATVANALELTDWINEVHHNTILVSSDFRPVPLRFHYFTREALMPLYKTGTNQLNSNLKFDNQGKKLARHLRAFDPNKLIVELHEKKMLPAIFFTFSRKGCDKYLFETRDLDLLTREERARLKGLIVDYVKAHPFLDGNRHLRPMANGFASHHAGLLPALKGLVEHLFQQGLIKVVFATETLAAGINMPARTTVITAISKRTNDGHRILTASEFLQMSGRAGRRGMDEVGYVVTVSSPYESAYDVALLASSPADPLNSRFTPTYGMVLNLLQKHSLEEAEFLISKSFGAFTAERRIQPLKQEIEQTEPLLEEVRAFHCPAELLDRDFQNFLKSKEMLKEAHKLTKLYKNQIKRHGNNPEMQAVFAKEAGKKASLTETIEKTACYSCDLFKQHVHLDEKIHRLEKRLKQLKRQFEEENNQYWQQFMNHYGLLKEVGFLDENDLPTEPGRITAQIRAENEFYMAQILLNNLLDDLTPPQLAGVVCALVNDSTRDNQFSKLYLSSEARQTLSDIQQLAKEVYRLQRKHRLETPMLMNPIASGLVEAWAEGSPWQRLIQSTSIDEGDLVRIIRRTADILRQLTRVDGLSSILSDKATLALKELYRDPIREEALAVEEPAVETLVTPAATPVSPEDER
jgi:superfamily II RNA helicase